jgi:DNA-binding beta-propeller fold protein YncE
VAFSPDGSLLAVTDADSASVSLFAVAGSTVTPNATQPTIESRGRSEGVAFSPDGSLLAVTNLDSASVSLFTVAGSRVTPNAIQTTVDTGTRPTGVAFSPDGSLLAVTNLGSASVSLFTVVGSTVTPNATKPTVGTGRDPYGVAFSPDGSLLAVTSYAFDSVLLYTVIGSSVTPNATQAAVSTGVHPYGVAFSPDGSLLAAANQGGSDGVSLFTVTGSTVSAASPAIVGTGRLPTGVAFSPDGSLLAASNYSSASVSLYTPRGVTGVAGSVSVAGGLTVGNTLTAAPDVTSTDPGTLSYQWLRDGIVITGAKSDTYTTTGADVGQQISVRVRATNYFGAVTSPAYTVVKASPVLSVTASPFGSVTFPGSVTLTATLAGAYPDSIGKTVAFNADVVCQQTGTNTVLTDAAGVATCILDNPEVRTWTFTPGFVGDANNNLAIATPITGYVVNPGTITPGTVAITGTAKVGQTQSADVGTPTPAGASPAYSWTLPGSNGGPVTVLGTDSTLEVPVSAAGKVITLTVTWSCAPNYMPTTATATTAAVAGNPVASVGLASVVQGGTQSVSATGFAPGESVTAVMHSDPLTIGTKPAGANGEVSFTWTIPATATPGAHTVDLTGSISGALTVPFTVTAKDDNNSGGGNGGGGPNVNTGGNLANTGASVVAPALGGAVVLLLAGAGLLAFGVRRRRV